MKKYALIIGIENYPAESGQLQVNYARNDAVEMAKYAKTAGFQLIGDGPILDEQATYSQIVESLDIMFNYVCYDNFVLLYYAGHGYYSEYGGFLIPYDYHSGSDKNESTCISYDIINKRLTSKKPTKFLFLLDTCKSGSAVKHIDIREGGSTEVQSDVVKARRVIAGKIGKMIQGSEDNHFTGRVVFTSSGLPEGSVGIEEYKHGLFTYNLLHCLKNKSSEPEINVEELIISTKKEVLAYSKKHNFKQTPVAYTNIQGEFLIPTYKAEIRGEFFSEGFEFRKNKGSDDMGEDNGGDDMDIKIGEIGGGLKYATYIAENTEISKEERSPAEKPPKADIGKVKGEVKIGRYIIKKSED